MDLREVLNYLYSEIQTLKKEIEILKQFTPQHIPHNNSTNPINSPTNNWSFRPLNPKILGISTGNGGVPTDRQTDQQTNKNEEFPQKDAFSKAITVLNTLDSLKKEIGGLFKQLTDQELLVLTTIYQMEEEQKICDYNSLSIRLELSQSSIRDYVGKLIRKSIPLVKRKVNNKQIHLTLSESLKKTISLSNLSNFRHF